ncbi:MAG TPA: SUMF1/EgtB/PvdO family nonheme iron enzyme [Bacteroidia bacterium]|nr:SUMF1/EgtB/PvdO family nonheme iron enzyme [Bacteroidia bacterium]
MYSKNIYLFNFFTLTIICLLLCTCTSTEKLDDFDMHVKDKNYQCTLTPPDGIKIANNLFYDQEEITNTNWREYLYWIKQVYGTSSDEYKAALPDTTVWVDSLTIHLSMYCLSSYVRYYLRHPAYNEYPVVGVSQKQATELAKWRSDRVMELILVDNGKIEWDSMQTRETHFTIERYFSGNYKNIKPDTNFKYYPCFRLPTVVEWRKAVHYSDSVNKLICRDTVLKFQSDIDPCDRESLMKNVLDTIEWTVNVTSGCKGKRLFPIYNLRGNVSEWTSDSEVCVGGGWIDKRQVILSQDTFHLKTQNAWTGFRNVCEWKKWTK